MAADPGAGNRRQRTAFSMKIYVLFFEGKAAFSNYPRAGCHIKATLYPWIVHPCPGIPSYILSLPLPSPSSLPPPLPAPLFLFYSSFHNTRTYYFRFQSGVGVGEPCPQSKVELLTPEIVSRSPGFLSIANGFSRGNNGHHRRR